jgi:hypothetical protein
LVDTALRLDMPSLVPRDGYSTTGCGAVGGLLLVVVE